MKYFSGFSLSKEQELFEDYTREGAICGFSYGAIKAFEEAYHSNKRVERVILLSPAFFQTQKQSFTKIQLRYFNKDSESYIENFIANTVYPSSQNINAFVEKGSYEQLEFLLNYQWDIEKIKVLKRRGVEIEVFIGERVKIVETESVMDFFSPFCTVYLLKNRGHSLQV